MKTHTTRSSPVKTKFLLQISALYCKNFSEKSNFKSAQYCTITNQKKLFSNIQASSSDSLTGSSEQSIFTLYLRFPTVTYSKAWLSTCILQTSTTFLVSPENSNRTFLGFGLS